MITELNEQQAHYNQAKLQNGDDKSAQLASAVQHIQTLENHLKHHSETARDSQERAHRAERHIIALETGRNESIDKVRIKLEDEKRTEISQLRVKLDERLIDLQKSTSKGLIAVMFAAKVCHSQQWLRLKKE